MASYGYNKYNETLRAAVRASVV